MGCKSSKLNTVGPLGSGAFRNSNKRSQRSPINAFVKLDTFRVENGQNKSDNFVRPIIHSPEEGEQYQVLMTSDSQWAVRPGTGRIQRPKAAKGPRTRHTDPVVEVCLPGCTVNLEDMEVTNRGPSNVCPDDLTREHRESKLTSSNHSSRHSSKHTSSNSCDVSLLASRNTSKKASTKTKKTKTKVTYFEVSQEREVCFTPIQELPPDISRTVQCDPDITQIVRKKRNPDMRLEPEGLLPGSVIEMESTRRKREEAEALRAWMERMEAREGCKL